jgi:tetratricopeptide (TPR) repeat protein
MLEAYPWDHTDEDRYQVGKCFYATGDLAQTERIMTGLVRQPTLWSDVRSKVYYALATLATRRGEIPAAISLYDQVLRYRPEDLDALCQGAWLGRQERTPPSITDPMVHYIAEGRDLTELAFKCVARYARGSQTLPRASEIAEMSCRGLLQFDHWEEDPWSCLAANIYHYYAEDLPRMQHELTLLQHEKEATIASRYLAEERSLLAPLLKAPRDPEALMALGRFYDDHFRFANAADVWEVLVTVLDDPSRRLAVKRDLAKATFRAGDMPQALTLWSEIGKQAGQDPAAAMAQALTAMDRRDYQQASDLLARAALVPSDFHQLASALVLASLVSTRDYSRVGTASAERLKPLLAASKAHLRLYEDDVAVMHIQDGLNWRVMEAAGEPDRMVTEWTEKLLSAGRQWRSHLSSVYLTDAALSTMHRGRVLSYREGMTARVIADLDAAESILMEVMAHKDKIISEGDSVAVYNLMEAWLSLGWSKFYRGDFEESDRIFTAVVMAAHWESGQEKSSSLYDWPRHHIQPKQMMEAYRGVGTSRDRLARDQFWRSRDLEVDPRVAQDAFQMALLLSQEALTMLEAGLALTQEYIAHPPPQFEYQPSHAMIDGRRDMLLAEEEAAVGRSHLTYIAYVDPVVVTENRFNYGTALYWRAKILWMSEQKDQAMPFFDRAEAELQAVVQKAPDHAESYRFLEYVAIYKGDLEQAERYFKEAKVHQTADLPDALLKLVTALDTHLSTMALEARDRNHFLIKRAHYSMELADHDTENWSLENAMAHARAVVEVPAICDPTSPYYLELKEWMEQGMRDPEGRFARNHTRILEILAPCLKAHKITTAHGVSQAPPR